MSSLSEKPTTLTGIVYYSKATQAFDNDSLRELADQSSLANAGISISGLLMYVDGYFMQYLEGDEEPLEKLINKIRKDERHEVLRQFKTNTLAARLFPAWSMRWLMDTDLKQTSLREKLSSRFEDQEGVSESEQAEEVWRIIDGLSAVYQRLA